MWGKCHCSCHHGNAIHIAPCCSRCPACGERITGNVKEHIHQEHPEWEYLTAIEITTDLLKYAILEIIGTGVSNKTAINGIKQVLDTESPTKIWQIVQDIKNSPSNL